VGFRGSILQAFEVEPRTGTKQHEKNPNKLNADLSTFSAWLLVPVLGSVLAGEPAFVPC
jgi:hypothetical protein